MNTYEILADATVAVHLAYMSYIVFGQLLIMIGWPLRWGWIRNPWFRLSHLAMILIVAFEAIMGWRCPLTDLEEHLREQSGQVVNEVRKDGHATPARWKGSASRGECSARFNSPAIFARITSIRSFTWLPASSGRQRSWRRRAFFESPRRRLVQRPLRLPSMAMRTKRSGLPTMRSVT